MSSNYGSTMDYRGTVPPGGKNGPPSFGGGGGGFRFAPGNINPIRPEDRRVPVAGAPAGPAYGGGSGVSPGTGLKNPSTRAPRYNAASGSAPTERNFIGVVPPKGTPQPPDPYEGMPHGNVYISDPAQRAAYEQQARENWLKVKNNPPPPSGGGVVSIGSLEKPISDEQGIYAPKPGQDPNTWTAPSWLQNPWNPAYRPPTAPAAPAAPSSPGGGVTPTMQLTPPSPYPAGQVPPLAPPPAAPKEGPFDYGYNPGDTGYQPPPGSVPPVPTRPPTATPTAAVPAQGAPQVVQPGRPTVPAPAQTPRAAGGPGRRLRFNQAAGY
jgi:hypothetical protein